MRVLGLITARGGSKGVPRKNIRPLGGKPLLAYTAESALQAKHLTRVILSTEDKEIAEIGRKCGLAVPFMRPFELAADSTPSLAVVRHALLTLESRGNFFDAVCLLQPTNPLRRSFDIDACIEQLVASQASCVMSVLPVPHEYNPYWVFLTSGEPNGKMSLATGSREPISRRQDLPPAFHRDGSVYVTRRDTIVKDGSLYGERVSGYEIDPQFSANIDTEDDWEAVERRIRRLPKSPDKIAPALKVSRLNY